MGVEARNLPPPNNRPHYFDEVGTANLEKSFRGAPIYRLKTFIFIEHSHPIAALVLISEVRDGVVYQYDSDASGDWRPSIRFAYRRIETKIGA